MTSQQQPGADWIYVSEGEELTTEQMTRQFLDLSWPEQVDLMGKLLEDVDAARACRMLNHEGAMIFATRHSCQPPETVTIEGGTVPEPLAVEPAPIICEAPEQCVCVCHKLGYVSHGDCCGGRS